MTLEDLAQAIKAFDEARAWLRHELDFVAKTAAEHEGLTVDSLRRIAFGTHEGEQLARLKVDAAAHVVVEVARRVLSRLSEEERSP